MCSYYSTPTFSCLHSLGFEGVIFTKVAVSKDSVQMNMTTIHMHGFGRGAMSCVEEGKAETSMGSWGEPEECTGATIAISLVAAKNHCYSYLCTMECCMMGVGTIARNA